MAKFMKRWLREGQNTLAMATGHDKRIQGGMRDREEERDKDKQS